MKSRKLLFLLTLCIVMPLSCLAQNGPVSIVVEVDGEQNWLISVADNPRITLRDGVFSIVSDKESFNVQITHVKRFRFENGDVIKQIKDSSVFFQKIGNDQYELQGLDNKESISLYDISGKAVPSRVFYVEGNATINLHGLTDGVYVIKIGSNQTIKILKK